MLEAELNNEPIAFNNVAYYVITCVRYSLLATGKLVDSLMVKGTVYLTICYIVTLI